MMPQSAKDKSPEELQNISTFLKKDSLGEYAGMENLFPAEERILSEYFPRTPARILDIGCGAGRTTKHLVERGYDVVAGDLLPEMIALARRRLPGTDFRVLDATRLDLPSDHFDVVWFSFNGLDCIYPFSHRLKALKEIHRVLKPGGLFVYSSHNILGRCTRISRPILPCIYHYHLGFLYHSLKKSLLQNYWRERHYEDGWLTLYCGTPRRQIKALERVGFEFVALESQVGRSLSRITWKDYWPHYVAKKPMLKEAQ